MTVILFAVNRNVEAVLGFREAPREEAEEVIKEFKKEAIDTVILTGDNKYTASTLSEKLNIDSKNELYSQEKVEIVQDFKNRGFTVAIVGNGINDAHALNAAD